MVADALTLVRPACMHAGIDLAFQPPQRAALVRGDAEALRQLVVNLVLNAVEAVSSQGRAAKITVDIERFDDGSAALHVRDTGPVPPRRGGRPAVRAFVSGKPEGTGLGLYVARQVAEAIRLDPLAARRRRNVFLPSSCPLTPPISPSRAFLIANPSPWPIC